MEDALAFGGALHLPAEPRRPREVRLPRAARQRDRADHDRDRRPGLAADDLPPLRPDESKFGRGKVLRAQVESRNLRLRILRSARRRRRSPYPVTNAAYLKLSAVADEDGGLSLFLLNRDIAQEMEVSIDARGFGRLAVGEAHELRHDDLKARSTTRTRPTTSRPRRCRASWSTAGKSARR